MSAHEVTAATNTTHLMWVGRWIEVVRCESLGEPAWRFKSGRDAADWLLYDRPALPRVFYVQFVHALDCGHSTWVTTKAGAGLAWCWPCCEYRGVIIRRAEVEVKASFPSGEAAE